MKFGHHGANHPVQDLDDGRVMITSQNHGFAVDESHAAGDPARDPPLAVRRQQPGHRAHRRAGVLSFQGHPEASAGPARRVSPLFDRFVALDRAGQGLIRRPRLPSARR
jgi:carbamoyl-phosphate synthase small subunit